MSLKQIDESSLERFVSYMRTKMEMNVDKPVHWSELSPEVLLVKLKEEVAELEGLMAVNGAGIEVLSECSDIANFSMFLAMSYKFKEAKSGNSESV
jgi:hypothetical protein